MDTESRLSEMENKLEEVLEIQHENGKKLDELLVAFKGSDISGEDGFAKRLKTLETSVTSLKEERTRNSVYIKIISWLAAIIFALIIAYMFNQAYQNNR